jgi:hypothetical protein
MATIRKTIYRCDACGETVPAKRDLVQFRVERGPRGYYSSGVTGIRTDLCDSCEVGFLTNLPPFYGDADAINKTLRRDPPKPPKKKKETQSG